SQNEKPRFASPPDSRAIVKAFADLFHEIRRGTEAKSIPNDFMAHLVEFVLHMTKSNPSVTASEMVGAADTSLQFLWLLLRDRGRI
ncbi:hypothetical protein FRC07_012091, partial [Ceratobasidium sp. 392]